MVTSTIDKYVRTSGGNLSRVGQMKALEKMEDEGFDISVQQTREIAGILGNLIDGSHDFQLFNDAALWGGARANLSDDYDYDSMVQMGGPVVESSVPTQIGLGADRDAPATSWIDGQQWMQRHKEQGRLYQAAITVHAMGMQGAAQLQGLNPQDQFGDDYLDPEKWNPGANRFRQDVRAWSEYKKAVATGAGSWEDTRTIGSYLSSAYRGIQLYETPGGEPDYTEFFSARAEFEEMIKSQSWGKDNQIDGEEAWRQTEAQLTANMSNTEFEFYNDMKLIRAYWDLGRDEIPKMRDEGLDAMADAWEDYLDSGPANRYDMTDENINPIMAMLISNADKRVRFAREAHRRGHPGTDAIYIKWSFVKSPLTPMGRTMKIWLSNNIQANQDVIVRQREEKQEGRR